VFHVGEEKKNIVCPPGGKKGDQKDRYKLRMHDHYQKTRENVHAAPRSAVEKK